MLKPFCHEQAVVIDGETLRLVLDFRAIDATEQLLGKGYDAILDELQKPEATLGFQGKVLWGLLREHHPELSFDQILTLQMGENGLTMGLALQKLLEAAFPTADKAKAENPPKRRGASRPS
jgi:hypothetical protein